MNRRQVQTHGVGLSRAWSGTPPFALVEAELIRRINIPPGLPECRRDRREVEAREVGVELVCLSPQGLFSGLFLPRGLENGGGCRIRGGGRTLHSSVVASLAWSVGFFAFVSLLPYLTRGRCRGGL